MVASFYGYKTDLVSLRRNQGYSLRGASLRHVMQTAEGMSLSPRPVRLEIAELKELKLPAILHWNFDHFVVLAKVSRWSITVHDPAVGIRKYTLQEASQRFTGVALELSPRQNFEPSDETDPLSLWTFWKGTNGLAKPLLQILLLSLLIQIFSLATPFYMQIVVDDVLIKHDADLLNVLALGFLGLTLISVLTEAIRGFSNLYLVNQLNFNIGNSLLYHLIRLPMSYFEKRHMGDVVSRFGSTEPIQKFISNGLITGLIDGLLAVTTLILMFIYAPTLTYVVLVSLVIYLAFRAIQFRPLRNANHENIAASAKLDSIFMESIRALQGIKLGGKELDRQNTWRGQFTETINTGARIGRLVISYEAANNTLTGCTYVLVIFLGAGLVLDGNMTIGMLYAFMAYRSNFSNAVVSIINLIVEYWMLGLHLERLADITQSEKEQGLETNSPMTLPVAGNLTAKGLGFRYAKLENMIFEDFNIDIGAGEFVGIHAPSGSGKTTLLKTLMGLLPPTSGEIFIDGYPLKNLGQPSFRQATASVMQGDVLFTGSIKENITFFDLTPDLDKIQEACEIACIHNDILDAPMGYDALVGDMGSSLSAGQQQRLLIARALYRSPSFLFLDEGTAHVDAQVEHNIMSAIKNQELTCIYVTHTPEMLRYADKVIRWENSEFTVKETQGQ